MRARVLKKAKIVPLGSKLETRFPPPASDTHSERLEKNLRESAVRREAKERSDESRTFPSLTDVSI